MANPTNRIEYLNSEFFTFNVFPNPAADKIHLVFNHPLKTNADLTIIDAQGKIVSTVKLAAGTTEFNLNLNQSGIYSVLVESNQTRMVKKVHVL